MWLCGKEMVLLTHRRKSDLVTSEKGKALQRKAWTEIAEVVREFVSTGQRWLLGL
jgi:hypothetical protein